MENKKDEWHKHMLIFEGRGQTPVTESDWCVKSTLMFSGEKGTEHGNVHL